MYTDWEIVNRLVTDPVQAPVYNPEIKDENTLNISYII